MCQHIFEGRADGVTCRLCGYHMTPQEYAEYLHPSTPEEPENIPAAPEKGEEPESPTGEPRAEPEPAPKKPRASGRKKEVAADE